MRLPSIVLFGLNARITFAQVPAGQRVFEKNLGSAPKAGV
jgi:hypothetical protein